MSIRNCILNLKIFQNEHNIKGRKWSLGDWKAFEVSTKWFQFNGNVYNIKTKIHEDYRFLLISRKFHLILYILHFDHKLKPDQLNVKQGNKKLNHVQLAHLNLSPKSENLNQSTGRDQQPQN